MDENKAVVKQKPVGIMAKASTLAAGAGLAVLTAATSSHAAIADLFAAVDITGAETAIQAFIIALVGIGLLFFGWRMLRRLGVSA